MDSRIKVFEENIVEAAGKNIAALLHQPKDLEQILKTRKEQIVSEKGTVDVMMKTMLQNHVENVKISINNLDNAVKETKLMRENLCGIKSELDSVKNFRGRFQAIREEQNRHSQMAAAVENAKQVFNVAEIVDKSKKLLEEGKLLLAHQSISDLEKARDDLLFEFYKQSSSSQMDQNTLEKYFKPVDGLSEALGKQVLVNMKRAINIVRKEPALVVTCLRIIEREERSDARAHERKLTFGFSPKSRPKGWRARCFKAMEESVKEKIEGSNITDANTEKTWLVKHLEVIRQIVLNDLSVVRGAAIPCFPPEYNVLQLYAKMYHSCIAKQFSELISHEELQAEDLVTLLTWLEEYEGPDCLGHPNVKIQAEDLGTPLMSAECILDLVKKYEDDTSRNIDNWLQRALNVEKSAWLTDYRPDETGQYLQTQTPTDVFQIFDQNINIASKMGDEAAKRMFGICLRKLADFSDSFRSAFTDFKTEKFHDREKLPNYTVVIMALINDCSRFMDYVQLWGQKRAALGYTDRIKECLLCFERVRRDAVICLLEEPMNDFAERMRELFSATWLKGRISEAMGVISATLKDYSNDYRSGLMPANFVETMETAQTKVLTAYLTAILDRRLRMRNAEERHEAAKRISSDMALLQAIQVDLVSSAPSGGEVSDEVLSNSKIDVEKSYEIFKRFGELLVCSEDMVQLELSTFVKRFPDCTPSQIARMLDCRGDMKFDFADLSKFDGPKILDVVAGEATKTKDFTLFSESPYRK